MVWGNYHTGVVQVIAGLHFTNSVKSFFSVTFFVVWFAINNLFIHCKKNALMREEKNNGYGVGEIRFVTF
jgi:hypothetical protein